jgi:hypothetical protein
MNERIQDLMISKGLHKYISADCQARMEMLAELIVRECADIADQERPNILGCGYITKTKGMLIRERFGVE